MKSLGLTALLTLTAFTAMTAQAQPTTKGDLACRFKSGEIIGTGKDSYASRANQQNKTPSLKKAQKTSVGTLTWGWAPGNTGNIVPFINGKPVAISKESQGTFRSGKVYDLGGKIILSYQVERMQDARTDPSQLTLLLGPGGAVVEESRLEGEYLYEHPCSLVI